MTTYCMPIAPTCGSDLTEIGNTIKAHLYTSRFAPGGAQPVSHDRTMNRNRLAAALHTSYNALAQILAGRRRMSDLQWKLLMRGGNQEGTKPLLPFDREEVEMLNSCWARLQASRTSYKAEPSQLVANRWLGWLEEGDELSTAMLKREIIEKFQHLLQPRI